MNYYDYGQENILIKASQLQDKTLKGSYSVVI
jgi:hypothetical protein